MLINIYWLLPEIFLTICSVILLTAGCIITKKGKEIIQIKKFNYLAAISFIFTAILLLNFSFTTEIIFISNSLLISNNIIILIKIILLITSAIIILLPNKIHKYEFSLLIILANLGMMLLISSNDLIILYLAIELISLSLYTLATINRNSQHSTEAGLKYFLLGALTSGFLLIGMTLLYYQTGDTNLTNIGNYIWYSEYKLQTNVGILFIIIALLFKLGAAPFHSWLPDVYEGSPLIITAFFATVPKIAIILTFINLIYNTFIINHFEIQFILAIVIIISLIVGSIGAINQAKIKRLISYSAICHTGFLLIGILPLSFYSIQGTLIYIFLYILMNINTFTILLNLNQYNYITQFSGLSRSNPILAFTFAITLLSIAGIPPLAGFFSKYIVLSNAITNEWYLICIIAIIASGISTFYYLRIIKWMFFKHNINFHYKDLGDVIFPLNNNINTNFISSIILPITTWIILTFLIAPNQLINLTNINIITSLI